MEILVLNLIITGIPSIPQELVTLQLLMNGFKPYYNWNTFNTNEIMNGLKTGLNSFKPYYNWNTFNT